MNRSYYRYIYHKPYSEIEVMFADLANFGAPPCNYHVKHDLVNG